MSTETNFCLGPLEREILEIVWTKDCPCVRCVLVEINKHRTGEDRLAYTTVMTIMKRLVKKQILTREKEGRSFKYQAKESKTEFMKHLAQYTIKTMKNKFGQPIIKALKKELMN